MRQLVTDYISIYGNAIGDAVTKMSANNEAKIEPLI